MSIVFISALAAAALAAVPPSIGSEPVPANFDYVPAPGQQQHVAFQGPDLAASLGSEPVLAGVEAGSSPVAAPGKRAVARATLADSLGSEPFIVAFDEGASRSATAADAARTTADRAKAVAAPEAELAALLAPQSLGARPEPTRGDSPEGRAAAAQPERAAGATACVCTK